MKTDQSTASTTCLSDGKQSGSWKKSMELLRLSEGTEFNSDKLNTLRRERRSSDDSWFSCCTLEFHNAHISKAEIVAKARRLTDPLTSPLFTMISDPEIDFASSLDGGEYYSRPPSPYAEEESQMEPISEEEEVNTLIEPQVSGLDSIPNSGSNSPAQTRTNSFYT